MSGRYRVASAFGLVVAGMVGLYFKVEYSGWVLAVGLLVLL